MENPDRVWNSFLECRNRIQQLIRFILIFDNIYKYNIFYLQPFVFYETHAVCIFSDGTHLRPFIHLAHNEYMYQQLQYILIPWCIYRYNVLECIHVVAVCSLIEIRRRSIVQNYSKTWSRMNLDPHFRIFLCFSYFSNSPHT